MRHVDLMPPEWLKDRDLRFLIENLPEPGQTYETIARAVNHLPRTLESLLQSDRIFEKIYENTRQLLDISPYLLFSVLVRRSLRDNRVLADPKVVNYLAHLLTLFALKNRLYRVHRHDKEEYHYIVDMVQAANEAESREQFLIHAHIGNYTLFLTGIFPKYLQMRKRRRGIGLEYYIDQGRIHYELASSHALAREYALDEVFFRLSVMFDVYQESLNYLAKQYLHFE